MQEGETALSITILWLHFTWLLFVVVLGFVLFSSFDETDLAEDTGLWAEEAGDTDERLSAW